MEESKTDLRKGGSPPEVAGMPRTRPKAGTMGHARQWRVRYGKPDAASQRRDSAVARCPLRSVLRRAFRQ